MIFIYTNNEHWIIPKQVNMLKFWYPQVKLSSSCRNSLIISIVFIQFKMWPSLFIYFWSRLLLLKDLSFGSLFSILRQLHYPSHLHPCRFYQLSYTQRLVLVSQSNSTYTYIWKDIPRQCFLFIIVRPFHHKGDRDNKF